MVSLLKGILNLQHFFYRFPIHKAPCETPCDLTFLFVMTNIVLLNNMLTYLLSNVDVLPVYFYGHMDLGRRISFFRRFVNP